MVCRHRGRSRARTHLLDAKRPGEGRARPPLSGEQRNPEENAINRTDIEVLYEGLPEPIDLELDLKNRLLYWTDRGDPPRGNTVNRAPMDADSRTRPAPKILYRHLMEGIGIAIDFKGGRMFFTDLAGSVYSARLDGSEKRTLLAAQGNLTGIAYVDIPQQEN